MSIATAETSTVAMLDFVSFQETVPAAFEAVEAAPALAAQKRIVLKPNMVNDSPPPITTPVACVEAVLEYCRAHSDAEIVIAEGCGGLDTHKAYKTLGYTELAARKGVELIDLDREELVTLTNPLFDYLPTFHMPKCLLDCFLISIPVLKAHSMSEVTLTLKNMVGIAPAKHYGGAAYRKSKLHGRNNRELHRYILELNQYRKADLTLLDATVGMAEAHIWGPQCDPPVNKIVGGVDPVAVDALGAGLLGFDWRKIDHIAMADGLLGHAVPEE